MSHNPPQSSPNPQQPAHAHPHSSPMMPGPPNIYYGPPPGHPGHTHTGGSGAGEPFSFAAPPPTMGPGSRPMSASEAGSNAQAQAQGLWNRQLPAPPLMDIPGQPPPPPQPQHPHAARRMTYQPPPSEPMGEYREWKHWRRDAQLPPQMQTQALSSPHSAGLPEGSFVGAHVGYAEPALPHMQLPSPSGRTGKRPRTESVLPLEPTANGQNGSDSAPRKKPAVQDSPEYKPAYPAVLTREKKQKACSNCRKAKLKCIVEPNQTLCVRCNSRKEKCIFYPRGHDDDWQQVLQTDLYNATNHLAQISNAVHHMLHHLTASNLIPPLYPAYERYEPPDREGYFPSEKRGREGDGDMKKGRKASKSGEDEENERVPSPESRAVNLLPTPTFNPYQPPHTAPLPSGHIISPMSTARLGPTQQPFGLPMPPSLGQEIEHEQKTPRDTSMSLPFGAPISPTRGGQDLRHHAGGQYPGQRQLTMSSMRDEPLPATEYEGMFVDEDGLEIAVGSMDTRTSVIKKDIVSNKDALVLIN
ncbi:hypothetical protein IAR50_006696 [Cryptococcus sp. DSM 104548]